MAGPLVPARSIPYDALIFERNRRGDRVELGRGAFSSVNMAAWLGEAVAAKSSILPAGASRAALAAIEGVFAIEASIMYHVRHEGIILVMPMLAVNLETAAAEPLPASPADRAVDLRRRLGWLEKVARALRFLHSSYIVHGDLKPANVLLDATRTRALVCDFGHA